MECRFAEQRLQALVDEELAPEELQEVLEHVASCKDCALALEDLHRVASLGKKVYSAELSTDASFLAGVLKKAEAIRGASTDITGQKIGGYEVLRKLGTGAMGSVYLARQVSLDRTVALKVLPQSMVKDKEFADRFIREARATAKLSHENVVHGIDAGRVGDVYYFAMEYVEGPSLRDIIRRKRRLPEAEAVDICIQMAKALEHAGQIGLIHRDIKPDNILVTSDGVAKLCDLGLARAETGDAHLTQDGFVVGTPHYIAPEQARGEQDIDARADIYALGSTLYMMVTGEVPFDGPTSAIVMARHITDPFPDPRKLVPEISDALVTVLFRMVAKEKDDRYRAASELRFDLESLRSGRLKSDTRLKQQASGSTSRTRRALAQRTRRSRAPSPASILLAGGSLVAGIAAVMIAFTGGRSRTQESSGRTRTGTTARPTTSEEDGARETSAAALVEIIRQRFNDEPTMAEDHLQLLDDAMPAIAGTQSEVDAIGLRTRLTRAARADAEEYVRRAIDSAHKLTSAERFDLALATGGPLDRHEAPARAKKTIDAERAKILTAAQELLDSRLHAAGNLAEMSEAEFMTKVVGLPQQLAERAETDFRNAKEFASTQDAVVGADAPVDMEAARSSLATLSREINTLTTQGDMSGARERLAEARRDKGLAGVKKQLGREDAFLNSVEDANGALIAALDNLATTHATVSLKTREGQEAIRGQVKSFSKDTMRLDLTVTMGRGEAYSTVEISKLDSDFLAELIRGRFADDAVAGAKAVAAFLVSRGEYGKAELAYRKAEKANPSLASGLERLLDVRRLILTDLFHCGGEPGENGQTDLVYDFRDARQLQDWQAHALPGDAAAGEFEHSVAGGSLLMNGLGGIRTKARFIGDVTVEVKVTLNSHRLGAAALVHIDDARPSSFYAAIAGFAGRTYLEKWSAGQPLLAGKIQDLPKTREVTISFERTTGKLSLKVADGPECTHIDGQYNNGSVGLVSLGSEVHFTEVRIHGTLDPDWLAAALSPERNRLALAMPVDSERQ